MTENPTLEAPEQPTQVAPKEIDIDALIATCEKAGVTNAKALEGKFEASKQAGNLANQLGDTRAQLDNATRELLELKRMMQETNSQRTRNDSYDDYTDAKPVNLQDEIIKGVRSFYKELQQEQLQAQERANRVVSVIHKDRYYPAVKEIWEAQMSDPTFQMQVRQGQVDPIQAYKDMVIEFQGNLLSQTIDGLKKTRGGGVNTPNVETGATRSPGQNLVDETPGNDSPIRRQQKELLAKVAKGYRATDDEILDTMDDVINRAFS